MRATAWTRTLKARNSGAARRRTVPRTGDAAALVCAVVCAVALAGCSGSSGGGAAATTAPATAAPATTTTAPAATTTASAPTSGPAATASSGAVPNAEDADLLLEIFVSGRTVAPKPSRHTVKSGDHVRILLTTDKANVVHVHGVDLARDVKAGVPTTLDFTVGEPGVYPVELHEPELLLAQLVVR